MGVKICEKPLLTFTVTEYYNLISDTWLEPLLTTNIKTSFLTNITVENVSIDTFDKYPSHTQSVETHVRLVLQISSVISSSEERDLTLLERKLMSRFSSKQNFFA